MNLRCVAFARAILTDQVPIRCFPIVQENRDKIFRRQHICVFVDRGKILRIYIDVY